MNKQGSLFAAVSLAAMLGLGGCGIAASTGAAAGQPVPSPPAMTASGDAMAGMIHVDAGAFRDAAPVEAGAMVSVMNMATAAYTLTSDDGTSFSVTVPPGAVVSFKAPGKPGSYGYHSDGPGTMHGVLTVRQSAQQATEQAMAAPPAAAAMVCSAEAKDNVAKILGLAAAPTTSQTWDGSVFSCSYALPDGVFDMSVQVFPGPEAAQAAAKSLAGRLGAEAITGLANLGLPGYQSAAGTVVFAKDNMALHVDAVKMSAGVGTQAVPKTDFAYQMATTILGCWTHG